MRAFAVQPQENSAFLGLAEQPARGRRFDAVRDGVAQQVQERLGQQIENLRVDFRLAAFDDEIDEKARDLAARYES